MLPRGAWQLSPGAGDLSVTTLGRYGTLREVWEVGQGAAAQEVKGQSCAQNLCKRP